MTPLRFPDGFAWGVATASYQNEGAVREDGRSPSIWDTFADTSGKIVDGKTGEVACDHYHRYAEDVDLLADLGVTHYRFSLAWPRLQPDGRSGLNAAGVDFYSRLIEALLERGIQPWVTLYHWDLPQVLEDAGGWPERDTASRFAEYAAAVHARLHDRVQIWTTLNEPWCSSMLGYAAGEQAPGLQDPGLALRAAHHLLLGHGLAIDAMRPQDDNSRFGITLNLKHISAASEDPKDADAARRIDLIANRMFLDPVLRGTYPPDFVDHVSRLTDPSYIQPGDENVMHAPLDALGINYYFGRVARAGQRPAGPWPWVGCDDVEFVPKDLPRTQAGWEIDPDGLHEVLVRVAGEYPDAPPLYVTENGATFDDQAPTGDGVVDDPQRIAYLDDHFRAARRAIADGVDLRGYFVWTLMDNFEWKFGYTRTFGLYHVDFENQRRTPKASARWFAEVTRANGIYAPSVARVPKKPTKS